MASGNESTALHYLVAAIAVFGAFGLRMVLDPILRDHAPYLIFVLGIVAASRFGGFLPGLVATVLGVVAVDWFFIEPRESLVVSSSNAAIGLLVFFATGAIISMVVGRLRSAGLVVAASAGGVGVVADTEGGSASRSGATARTGGLFGDLKQRPHLAWLGFALLLVVAEAVSFVGTWTRFSEREQATAHTYQVVEEVASVFSALQDAETGQRGYLLTGKDAYLQPYEVAAKTVSVHLAQLRLLTADNLEQQKRAQELITLVAEKLEELRLTISLRKSGGQTSALEIVQTDRGKQVMDRIRDIAGGMRTAEFSVRDARRASLSNAVSGSVAVMLSGIGLLVLVLVGGSHAIDQHIDRRAQSERDLREAVERYQRQVRLFDGVASTTPDFVYLFDRQGRFLYANRRLLEVWGMTLSQVTGKSFSELGYEQWHHDMHMREIAEVIATRSAIKGEVPFRAPLTGIFGVYEYIFTPVFGPDGEVEIIAGTTRDVTERKHAEGMLRESEKRYRILFETMNEGVVLQEIVKNEAGDPSDIRYLAVNPAFERHTGINADHFVGHTASELFPESVGEWLNRYKRMIRDGSPQHHEEWFAPLNRWLHSTLFPTEPGQFCHVLLNVTERKRGEEALRQSLERLEKVLEIETVGVMFWDLSTGCMVDANDAFLNLMGYNRSHIEARELTWQRLTPPEYMDVSRAEVEKFLATGRVGPYEKEYFRSDGSRLWLLFAGSSLGNNQCVEFCIDISTRKEAEQAVRKNEARQSFLVALNDALRPLADPAEIRLEASRILGEHLGAGRAGYAECEEDGNTVVVLRHYTDGIPGVEGRHKLIDYGENLASSLLAGRPVIHEDIAGSVQLPQAVKAAFAAIAIESMANIPLLKAGQLVAVLFVHYARAHSFSADEISLIEAVADRTWSAVERARAEAALRESEERFRLAQELSPDGFTILRPVRDAAGHVIDFTWVYQNAAIARLSGTDPQVVHNRRLLELFPAHRGTEILKAYQDAAERGERRLMEAVYQGETIKEPIWFRLVVVPAGTDIAVLSQDITERKKAEERLRASEEKFSKAFATNPAALMITRIADGFIVDVNATWEGMMGYSRAEAVGHLTNEVTTWATAEASARWTQELREKGVLADREQTLLRRSGAPFVVLLSAVIVEIAGEEMALSAWLDISDRKQAERALAESEERLRLAQQAGGVGTFDWNIQTGVNTWTPELERLYGLPPGSFARTQPSWENLIHPEDRAAAVARVSEAIATCEPGGAEWRVVWPDGSIHWLSGSWRVLQDESGAPLRLAGANIDITERKLAEEQVQQAKDELEIRVLERTAQLEAANRELEAFSYSVSHDLRAPLRGIDGWSLALVEDYNEQLDDKARGYLARVRSEAQRMGALIDDMLLLSRVTRSQMQNRRVDLTTIAERVAGRLKESQPDRHIEFDISPSLTAKGDANLLEIALTNLLGNAAKFTGPRENARIEFGAIDVEGESAFFVRDNGVGFNMAYADKLFGAFQRLHRPSQFPGTGIGLATVQRIVHRHGGRVWAEAEQDKGAAFYFTLASR